MNAVHIQDFSGGLNLKDSPHSVRENEAVYCENFTFSRTGEAEVRKGYRLHHDTEAEAPTQGLYRYYSPQGPKLLTVAGGKLYDDLSGTEIFSGFTPTSPITFSVWDWKGYCFLSDGVSTIGAYDGTQFLTDIPVPFVPKLMTVYANRLWLANDPADPYMLRWGELGDTDEWPVSNFAVAQGEITGLVPGFGQLYILTPNRIEMLVGTGGVTTTEGIHTLIEGVGCVAPRTVATHAGLTFFLGQDGVWQFFGGTVQLVSRNIEPVVTGLTTTQKNTAVGAIYDGRYWLSLEEAGKRVTYVYDIQHKWWTKFTGLDITTFAIYDGIEDTSTLLTGDSSGRVWKQNSGDLDDDRFVAALWRSKVFIPGVDWNMQFRQAILRTIHAYGDTEVRWSIDQGRESGAFLWRRDKEVAVWGSAIWGKSLWSGFLTSRFTEAFPMRAVGESIQFTILQKGLGSVQSFTARTRAKRKVV